MKPQAKVSRVMREFKKGDLKSSSGQKVTNPKQAIAIGLSEAGISKKAKGGEMKESKAMMKKEVSFMKKKGAPKSMLKHEMKEAGMKRGGKTKKMALGGMSSMVQGIKNKIQPNAEVKNVSSGPRIVKDYVGSGGPKDPTSPGYVRPNFGSGPRTPKDYVGSGGPKDPTSPGYVRPNFGIGPNGPKKMAMGGTAGTSLPPSKPRRGPSNPGPMPRPLPKRGSGPNDAGPGRPLVTPPVSRRFEDFGLKKGGGVKKMAGGGLAAGHKSADGVASKGKTKAKQVVMKGAGKGMKKGGYC